MGEDGAIKEEEKLQEIADGVVRAFNEFHSTIEGLQGEQREVMAHIREQIDQKKIAEIQEHLKNVSQ